MKKSLLFFAYCLVWSLQLEAQRSKPIDKYSLAYSTFSDDSQASLPIGNGDIALNVWTEANGDILFYIGKSDAWSEAGNTQLVKVGRIRVSVLPNPFRTGMAFLQSLKLSESSVTVQGDGTTVKIWVDANAPAVRAETVSKNPVSMTVALDPWRTAVVNKVSADVVVPDEKNRILWYHRTDNPNLPSNTLTFGAAIQGKGWERGPGNQFKTITMGKNFSFVVTPFTSFEPTVASWKSKLEALADKNLRTDPVEAWKKHCAWWDAFWDRSHLFLDGDSTAFKVSAGYNYQRYLSACTGRGAYPMKFNGTIFNMDNPARTKKDKSTNTDVPDPQDADIRDWGGQYWFQNTRPMYWPLLASGDYDLMLPLFKMYKDMLPKNLAQTKEFYRHDGAYFQETAPFWGGIPKLSKEEKGSYTKHYYLPIIELGTMMLDYFEHTQDQKFARETLLPVANAGLTFYARHFGRDTAGKLLLDSVNSIEMYWKVVNPTPDIAGLRFLLGRLMSLSKELISQNDLSFWNKLFAELPEIPTGKKNGRDIVLPYQGPQTAPKHNTENPELYAVHPFRVYGIGKPDLSMALATFQERAVKRVKCWHQDAIDEAYLGLAEVAKKDVTATLLNKDPRFRFPGFWEKGHDYAPDADNGGNGQHALQLMLMQCEDKKIILLPAWPKGWNAEFKLKAPYKTTVQAIVRDGKIFDLKVDPLERRGEVILANGSKL